VKLTYIFIDDTSVSVLAFPLLRKSITMQVIVMDIVRGAYVGKKPLQIWPGSKSELLEFGELILFTDQLLFPLLDLQHESIEG